MAKENYQIYIECTLYILKEHQRGIYSSLSLRIAMIQYDDRIQSESMSYLYYRKWRRYSARPQCILVECGPLTSVAKAMKVLRKLGCCLQIEVGIVVCAAMVVIKLFCLVKFQKLLRRIAQEQTITSVIMIIY